jgi:tetratricopeptide (TPR) repeat protein
MKQFSLAAKLLGGFICVALITLAVGYLGWTSATRLSGSLDMVGKQNLPSIQNLLIVQKNLEAIRTVQNALLNPVLTAQMRTQQMERVAQARDNYQKAFKIYDALPKHSDDARIWEQTKASVQAWKVENDKFFTMAKELDKVEADKGDLFAAMNKQFLEKCLPHQNEALALVDKIVKLDEEEARQTMLEAGADAARTKWLSVVGMITGTGLALALGIMRWIFDHDGYDARFLSCANRAASVPGFKGSHFQALPASLLNRGSATAIRVRPVARFPVRRTARFGGP